MVCLLVFDYVLFDKILPTLLSGIIAILLFISGRILDTYLKSKEQKRNWYLKVIIDPNIKNINAFFTSSLSQFKSSLNILMEQSVIGHNEYLVLKSTEFGKFSSLKRDFYFEFLKLIGINYPAIETELTNLINTLEDNYMKSLDNIDTNTSIDDIIKDFEKEIYSVKSFLIAGLYKPLIYKKVTLFGLLRGK